MSDVIMFLQNILDNKVQNKGTMADNKCFKIENSQDENARLKEFSIRNDHYNPDELLILSLDNGKNAQYQLTNPLKIGGHDYHKTCDSLIIVHTKNKIKFIHLECKSQHENNAKKQLKSSHAFAKYLEAIIALEFASHKLVYIHKFLILSVKSLTHGTSNTRLKNIHLANDSQNAPVRKIANQQTINIKLLTCDN